jgi:hypothetical protein
MDERSVAFNKGFSKRDKILSKFSVFFDHFMADL